MSDKQFDLIIWGASGFTGQLVTEYLVDHYGVNDSLHWAIAGRNLAKLEQVRARCLGTVRQDQLQILLADSDDRDSLEKLVAKTRVVCSTVGPYALFGTAMVAACARAGTHYCDLSGEVAWMADMIERYQSVAQDSGARIVPSCGFDSIPSDLGTWFLQRAMRERYGVASKHVKCRIGRIRGAISGGTIASILNMQEEAGHNADLRRRLADPYALYPADIAPGEDGPDATGISCDPDFHQWISPFAMAVVNTRVVRRSNALMAFPWGTDFRYDEAVLHRSHLHAAISAAASGAGLLALSFAPTRKLATQLLPKSGDGPDRKQRENGSYEIFFHGAHPQNRENDKLAKVTGDMDPGYGSTSKMLGEAAVCLAQDELSIAGGLWTPASAMGDRLCSRLVERAGLTMEIIR